MQIEECVLDKPENNRQTKGTNMECSDYRIVHKIICRITVSLVKISRLVPRYKRNVSNKTTPRKKINISTSAIYSQNKLQRFWNIATLCQPFLITDEIYIDKSVFMTMILHNNNVLKCFCVAKLWRQDKLDGGEKVKRNILWKKWKGEPKYPLWGPDIRMALFWSGIPFHLSNYLFVC